MDEVYVSCFPWRESGSSRRWFSVSDDCREADTGHKETEDKGIQPDAWRWHDNSGNEGLSTVEVFKDSDNTHSEPLFEAETIQEAIEEFIELERERDFEGSKNRIDALQELREVFSGDE